MRNPKLTAFVAVLAATFATTVAAGPSATSAQGSGALVTSVDSSMGASDEPVVDRDKRGRVVLIRSASGTSFRAASAGVSPRRAALGHAARYARAFGVDASDLVATRVAPSATGGSVVHLRQQVDGLPVLGGELVMSLAAGGGLLSVAGRVATGRAPGMGGISSGRAVRVALASVAKRADRKTGELVGASEGEWVYEPELLGVRGGLEPRRVWRVEVTDGAAVRQMVLVDAATGRVLLHVDQVKAALERRVCDNQNQQQSVSDCAYVSSPARTETGPVSAVADVNSAFELTGAAGDMYAEVGGLDLTQLIGSGGATKRLSSWVRYCTPVSVDPTCPMPNAFWSGREMFFGDGYAGADDVVAHEMTHGVIEKFSDLFYFHQSGAINESLADILGEFLDHRHASAGDAPGDWRLGEDLPGGAIRDLADPTLFGQPDKMTSPLYDPDPLLADNGGVHTNSGVGNKTAYLISQGGTFNGVTVTGVDGGDPALTKTATLYVEVLKRLTSGAGYADLGRTLEQTCAELAAAETAAFTTGDCDSVSAAVSATELAKSPTVPGAAPLPDVAASCPAGTIKVPLFSNDGSLSGLGPSHWGIWTTAPYSSWGVPANARTGTTSLFAFNPDPGTYGDPWVSHVTMTLPASLPAGEPAYLHFDQWRLFEWTDGPTPTYNDGGTVTVLAAPDLAGTYTAQALPAEAWVNGPTDPLALTDPANPMPGFGGDSHGWTSSRLDLSSLSGQAVKIRWVVRGDVAGSYIGWFLDNLSVYSCHTPAPPGPVTDLSGSPLSGPRVRLTWNAPMDVGDGLSGYLVTRSDGEHQVLPADANTLTTGTLARDTRYSFKVRTLGAGGVNGTARSVTLRPPDITMAASATKVRKGTRIVFKGTAFEAGTRTPAKGQYLTLKWRRPGTTQWRSWLPDGSVLYDRVASDATFKIAAVAKRTLIYRVVLPSSGEWFPGTSNSVKVRVTG